MGSLFLEGLILQASLIFALGAQNLFVLEAGLRRQNHLTVSLVCFVCDFVMIMLGVAGAATIFSQFPEFKIFVGLLGVSFLFTYGISKIFAKPEKQQETEVGVLEISIKRSIILAATFSILNPHAYLDAFILIGGFSTKYDALQDRVMLGLGAACYSGLWFLVLSSFSAKMKPILSQPVHMQRVMAIAGLALVFLSGKLGLDVMDWIMVELHQNLAINVTIPYPQAPGMMFTSILF